MKQGSALTAKKHAFDTWQGVLIPYEAGLGSDAKKVKAAPTFDVLIPYEAGLGSDKAIMAQHGAMVS